MAQAMRVRHETGRLAGLMGLALGLGSLLVSGCGTGLGEVSGTVRYNGQPLPFGTVQIESIAGTVHPGTINPDGTYIVTGVPTGPARICVTAVDEKALVSAAHQAAAKSRATIPGRLLKKEAEPATIPAPAKGRSLLEPLIPAHYGEFATSGLNVEVKRGPTRHDIDL